MDNLKLGVSRRGLLEVTGSLFFLATGYTAHWLMTRKDVPNAVKETEQKAAEKYGAKLEKMDEIRRKDNELFRKILETLINNPK